ncbi:MAG: hypothetical protein E7675_00430 [Ruminococcaceae bacterium]|nr:hypothetical protein [Oscillospiraceae bacterium]
MKRIISFLMAALCLFAFVACSTSTPEATAEQRPEIYDLKILSVNGEDITYEYYRYYYLFVKDSYEESGTEITEEKIKQDVLDKLRYDAAIHKLLDKYSQSLTAEEIKECEDYVAMYVSAYGDVFETQLESEMNMTLDVFTKMTLNEMAYNKLYTYLSDEKLIDTSDSAVKEYMSSFRAAMHLILTVDDEKNDAEKKELIEKLYKMAEFDLAFDPILKLHELRQSLKNTQKSIDDINKQIADGKSTDELAATLESLVAQISAISAKITEEQSKIDVAKCLEGYIEKLDIYKTSVKADIDALANSQHAELVGKLESASTSDLAGEIAKSVVEASKSKLSAALLKLAEDKSTYGWFKADFVAAIKSFNTSHSIDDLNKILDFYKTDSELKTNKTVVALLDCFTALQKLMTPDLAPHDYLSAIEALNGSNDIKVDIYEKAALYASLRNAKDTASELKGYTGTDIHTKLEDAFTVLSAPITTFEELVINYSDDYEAESGSVVFYLKPESLLTELQEVCKDLKVGEMTKVVKSSIGYHILKLVEPDLEYFKKNEYLYYVLEDMLNAESEKVEYTPAEAYEGINKAKMSEYETELKAQKNAIAAGSSSSNTDSDNDNTVLWTIIIIGITVAVVAVLVVLIVLASKPEAQAKNKNSNQNKTKKKK